MLRNLGSILRDDGSPWRAASRRMTGSDVCFWKTNCSDSVMGVNWGEIGEGESRWSFR